MWYSEFIIPKDEGPGYHSVLWIICLTGIFSATLLKHPLHSTHTSLTHPLQHSPSPCTHTPSPCTHTPVRHPLLALTHQSNTLSLHSHTSQTPFPYKHSTSPCTHTPLKHPLLALTHHSCNTVWHGLTQKHAAITANQLTLTFQHTHTQCNIQTTNN